MKLSRLEVDDPRWLELWEAWELRQPFAHPLYARLFAPEGETPFALVGEDEQGAVLFPLLHREVPGGGRDLSNPYGYGGPFRIGAPDEALFWPAALAWADLEGYATLFARLSLFGDDLVLPEEGVQDAQPNVVRTLDLDPETMFMDYDHKVRKNVKRAYRSGLRVEFDEAGIEIAAFAEIYLSTMGRNAASAYYRFPEAIFTELARGMPGTFVFVHVFREATIVSTELVLRSARTLYSFLGGTEADAFEDRPNDLLKHETILWGRREGYREYVLGGGVATPETGGEDGIFRYKLAFAPEGRRTFRTLRLTTHPAEAERLMRARDTEPGWTPRPGFFPPYRA